MSVCYKRHIIKAITWRGVGTLDTIFLSWIITGNYWTGFKIGALEIFSKTFLYYIHERFWFKMEINNSQKRHLFKTLTWRLVGSIDTITLVWIISGNPFTGFSVGIAEVITKMILYYFHERIWYKVDYGVYKKD